VPAGMRGSRYCSDSEIVKGSAHGYDAGPGGLVHAAYLTHVWPFSAGSLCSTVGDLVAWNRALHGVTLMSERSYRELVTPGVLNDGTRLRYAKGVAVDSLHGRRAVHHGGDIPGFASELQWFPDGEISIVVLMNSEGPVRPQAIAHAIGAALFPPGTPSTSRRRGMPDEYAGRYRASADSTSPGFTIVSDSAGGIAMKISPTAPPLPLRYLGGETFEGFEARRGAMRLIFQREQGRVTAVRFDPVYRNGVLQRVDAR